MKKQIQLLAAIMFCGIALAACSDKDNDDINIVNNPDANNTNANVETVSEPSQPQAYTLTIKATKGGDASLSKALALNGNRLDATWEYNDMVLLFKEGDLYLCNMTAQSDGAETTLSGTLYRPLAENDVLILKNGVDPDYTTQNGSLEYISQKCDYAIATVTVKEITANGEILINEPTAKFENQQAIVKFTLSSLGSNINATSLKVNGYTITPQQDATNEFYVAIPDADAKNIYLSATDGTDTYTFYKENAKLVNGQYYTINVKSMTKATKYDLSTLTGDTEIPNGAIVTGELNGKYKISIADGATVTLSGATIEGEDDNAYEWAGITCDGDATIILEGDNNVKGFRWGYPGIYIAEDKTLTIDGTGTLNASSNGSGAGIGGGVSDCGNITINGGTINAVGKDGGAGLGVGYSVSCGAITINGGVVNAIGEDGAAGIGGNTYPYDIIINGGTVTAVGGLAGAGIGSSANSARCGNIIISGGNITATGGNNASGIGSGSGGHCDNIIISGGTIIASGGKYAAGIGNGLGYYSPSCGDITITVGVEQVTAIKGDDSPNSIGTGYYGGDCGTITIEDETKVILQ
ncbi:MAG: hypothetical protein J5595_05140 [Bacteroidales bacterium]|nr:hypothetical protein [Bacteroidales bacterium]